MIEMTPEKENGPRFEILGPPSIEFPFDGSDSTPAMPSAEDIQVALDIARQLIKAGVPVFAAPPVPGSPGQYQLPKHWEKTVPSEVWLDPNTPNGWRPGWALAAVGGHACDFLDVDPRNGGTESLQELHAAGHFPLTFGRQTTPSGGTHDLIAPTGERKSTGFMPGIDLQSGAPGGVGRGFVWIAPTVRASKDPRDRGALKAYRWIEAPDLNALDDAAQSARDSTQGLIDRIAAKRSAPRDRAPAPVIDAHAVADPFLDASMTGGARGESRAFTLRQAQDFVRPYLLELEAAQIGSIEETANQAAAVLSHFVPTFWTVDQGMTLLRNALARTAYDPNGPSDWTAEKFRAVLDGRRPPRDSWKAERRPEPEGGEGMGPKGEGSTGGRPQTTQEWADFLLSQMLDPDALEARPRPKPLVQGLLSMDSLAWIIGAPGSFKSFVAVDIAAHVASGMPWRGRSVTRGRVIYLAAEGANGMTLRVGAWRKEYGRTLDLITLPLPVQAADPVAWSGLVQACKQLGPVMVVVDTQARVTVGMEENSNSEMNTFIGRLDDLRIATGACVTVVHHTGRDGKDARGASAIDGAQDTELKVTPKGPRKDLRAEMSVEKQKDGPDGIKIKLQLKAVDMGTDPETGEPLDTLVLVAPPGEGDPFYSEQVGQEELPEWLANLTENQREVMDALEAHTDHTGATRSQVIGWIKERRATRDLPPLKPTSVDSAVKSLRKQMLITDLGASRWARSDALE